MYIKRSIFQEEGTPGDWLVKGKIGIDGEFTREEWMRLRQLFIAIGLFQVHHGKPLSQQIPSRQEVIAAVQDVTSGRDPEAWNKVCAKYNLPDGSIFNISTGQMLVPPKDK